MNVQRYAPFAGGSMIEDDNGPLVRYTDHEADKAAAVEAARAEGYVAGVGAARAALEEWFGEDTGGLSGSLFGGDDQSEYLNREKVTALIVRLLHDPATGQDGEGS